MIRRMRESNDNIFYCAECTYDKSNGTMFLYTTDITEVRGSVKPKDSMKVEGGFLVRRKYFRSEYEAQEYIDSLPNAMPMSRNESFRMSKSNGKRGLHESGVSDYIAQMSTLGYAFNGMIEDTLDFEDRDGEVLKFYGWDEVDDFINDGTLPSDNFDSSWQRYKSKNKLHSVESMRRNRSIKEGRTMPYVLWVLDGDTRQWEMYKGVNDAKQFIRDNDYDEFLDELNTQVFPNETYYNNYIDWVVIPAGEEPRKFDTHKFYNSLKYESMRRNRRRGLR
jgi:hypothetical protein